MHKLFLFVKPIYQTIKKTKKNVKRKYDSVAKCITESYFRCTLFFLKNICTMKVLRCILCNGIILSLYILYLTPLHNRVMILLYTFSTNQDAQWNHDSPTLLEMGKIQWNHDFIVYCTMKSWIPYTSWGGIKNTTESWFHYTTFSANP